MAELDLTYATIVSVLPKKLTENKPGINPWEYIIEAAPSNGMSLTVIPNNAYYLVNPDPLADAKDVRQIKVPVPAIELAESLINDYVNALVGVDPPEAVPGLFCVRGNYTEKQVVTAKFKTEIEFYKAAQIRWYQNLINVADDAWSKSHSPITISDLDRMAAKELGYERDWINPAPSELTDKCPVCKSAINHGAVKCIACGHILNKIEYDKILAMK